MANAQKQFDIPSKYEYQYRQDYSSDWDIHRNYIQSFDAYEAMLMGQVYDSVSNTIDGSKITDSYATTLAKERADRVMAKLPEGETEAMGSSDVGKAAFMDILRQKWIYPNANAQHSFQEKLNMWQFYSSVYGYMPMFYDWNVSASGYNGPDCWLWNPRNLVPQQGRTSINDMEYVTALTWVSKSYLLGILSDISDGLRDNEGKKVRDDGDPKEPDNMYDEGGWDKDALSLLVQIANQSTSNDIIQDTKVTRDRTPQATKRGVCLATRYEAGEDGEWITFAPDHGNIEVRRLKNPHKNGRIPFVIKYSQPLFDSFYGLGDFQRAKPLQFARDGLTNFYFKGIKMNLIPPVVVNANGVLKHTIDYREGGVMFETIPNSIRRLETSSAGLATYQAAQTSLTGALLSLYGSQNSAISTSDSMNPSQGKTPQAIDLYADKEATRDGSERRHLEDAIQTLTDGFFTLVANIGSEEIPVAMFSGDIKNIEKMGYTDVTELFTGMEMNDSRTAGVLKINPSKLKDITLRFKIATDSTAKVNKQAQLQSIVDMIGVIGKMQNVFQDDPRFTVHWEKIMDTYEALSDVPGASEFVSFDPEAQKQPEPQSQPATAVTMPGGQVHESADLVKMFIASTNNVELQNAILQTMGLPPLAKEEPVEAPAPQGPTVTSSGHTFNDPHVAQAAEALNAFQHPVQGQPMPKPAEESQPTITSSGHAFNDGTIASAADAIHNFAPPAAAGATK